MKTESSLFPMVCTLQIIVNVITIPLHFSLQKCEKWEVIWEAVKILPAVPRAAATSF